MINKFRVLFACTLLLNYTCAASDIFLDTLAEIKPFSKILEVKPDDLTDLGCVGKLEKFLKESQNGQNRSDLLQCLSENKVAEDDVPKFILNALINSFGFTRNQNVNVVGRMLFGFPVFHKKFQNQAEADVFYSAYVANGVRQSNFPIFVFSCRSSVDDKGQDRVFVWQPQGFVVKGSEHVSFEYIKVQDFSLASKIKFPLTGLYVRKDFLTWWNLKNVDCKWKESFASGDQENFLKNNRKCCKENMAQSLKILKYLGPLFDKAPMPGAEETGLAAQLIKFVKKDPEGKTSDTDLAVESLLVKFQAINGLLSFESIWGEFSRIIDQNLIKFNPAYIPEDEEKKKAFLSSFLERRSKLPVLSAIRTMGMWFGKSEYFEPISNHIIHVLMVCQDDLKLPEKINSPEGTEFKLSKVWPTLPRLVIYLRNDVPLTTTNKKNDGSIENIKADATSEIQFTSTDASVGSNTEPPIDNLTLMSSVNALKDRTPKSNGPKFRILAVIIGIMILAIVSLIFVRQSLNKRIKNSVQQSKRVGRYQEW